MCRAVEAAGGTWVLLDQVCLPDLPYTPEAALVKHLDNVENAA